MKGRGEGGEEKPQGSLLDPSYKEEAELESAPHTAASLPPPPPTAGHGPASWRISLLVPFANILPMAAAGGQSWAMVLAAL